MTKPWMATVAALSGLFVIGVAVRQFRTSRSEQPDGPPVEMASHALENDARGTQGGGWIAKPDTGAPLRSESGVRPQARAAGASGVAGSHAQNAQPSGSGGTNVVLGGGGAGGDVAVSGSSGPVTSGSIQAEAAVPGLPKESLPFRDANNRQEKIARETSALQNGNKAADQNTDENSPVLAFSFDKTTLPEKGDAAPVVEQGITFNSEGAHFATDAQFVVPDAGGLTGEAGSITFCAQPEWSGTDQGDAYFASLVNQNVWDNRVHITKNGTYLRFLMADNTGQETNNGVNIGSWQAGERHLVTATWGDALASLYVDGQMVSQQTYPGQLELPAGTPLYVGSGFPGTTAGAQASLSNLQLYNRALPAEEVAGLTANCSP
jgi:hypothetical protein